MRQMKPSLVYQRAAASWRSNAEQALAETRAELRLLRDPATRESTAKVFRLSSEHVAPYVQTLEAQEKRLTAEIASQRA